MVFMPHKHMLSTLVGTEGSVSAATASIRLGFVTFGLVAFAFALTGTAAAQNSNSKQGNDNQMPQITVQAAHEVQKKQVGMTYTGIPIEEVSLSRHVGFRDLDLTIPAGKEELDKRIKAVAKEACEQLEKLYPLEQWETDTRTCIADAVKGAMKQEQTILASSLKK
jgi:UrcA family protein